MIKSTTIMVCLLISIFSCLFLNTLHMLLIGNFLNLCQCLQILAEIAVTNTMLISQAFKKVECVNE